MKPIFCKLQCLFDTPSLKLSFHTSTVGINLFIPSVEHNCYHHRRRSDPLAAPWLSMWRWIVRTRTPSFQVCSSDNDSGRSSPCTRSRCCQHRWSARWSRVLKRARVGFLRTVCICTGIKTYICKISVAQLTWIFFLCFPILNEYYNGY